MNNQEAIVRIKNIINKSEAESTCHVDSGDKKALEIAIQSIRTLRAIELIYKMEPKQKIDW